MKEIETNKKKYFLGWINIKWFIKELIATMSDEPSYLSKKRVQEWMLFLTAWLASGIWFICHFIGMEIGTLLAYTATLFAYAGYQKYSIQKEKRDKQDGDTT